MLNSHIITHHFRRVKTFYATGHAHGQAVKRVCAVFPGEREHGYQSGFMYAGGLFLHSFGTNLH